MLTKKIAALKYHVVKIDDAGVFAKHGILPGKLYECFPLRLIYSPASVISCEKIIRQVSVRRYQADDLAGFGIILENII